MNIQKLYTDAAAGKNIDKEECIAYLKSIKKIVIWGAGNLGQALGRYLMEQDITISAYWDVRCETVKECLKIKVEEPFANTGAKEEVIVILAITNSFIKPHLIQELEKKNVHFLEGELLYQGLVCPQTVNDFHVDRCNHRKECNVAICERMGNLMYAKHKQEGKLFIHSLDVYVTQKCTLQCKYCYIYTNSYPKNKRVLFKTQQILDDIDRISDAASYIKRIVPFGGEPFLHYDLDVIVEHMASKENIGIIDIISNGVFNYPVEKLERLRLPNVRIDISNYNMSLDQRLIDIRNKNCELLQSLGLNVTVHNETPLWRKPGRLTANDLTQEELVYKKQNCANFAGEDEVENRQTYIIKDGKFFTCQHCDTIYNLGIDDQSKDYVELSKSKTREELVDEIQELVNRKYYSACKYCNPSSDVVSKAGEQGMDDIYRID